MPNDIYDAHLAQNPLGMPSPALTGQNMLVGPLLGVPSANGLTVPGITSSPVSLAQMLNAMSVSYDAYLTPAFRTARYNPDALIMGKGYQELDDMKTMACYDGPLRLVKYAVLLKESSTEPRVDGQVITSKHIRYDAAQEAADLIRHLMHNIIDEQTGERQDFRVAEWYLLEALHHGFAVLEKQFRYFRQTGKYEGVYGINRLIPRTPLQIGFNLNPMTNAVVSLNNWTPSGIQYDIGLDKWLLYTFQGSRGLPYGNPVSRRCYKHVLSINSAYETWALAQERFAGGFLKVQTKFSDETLHKATLAKFDGVRKASTLVYGPDLTVDLEQSNIGQADLFARFIEHHETSIVKEILGQELTTQTGSGVGAYALGAVHAGTQKFFLSYPRNDLEQVITNQLYAPLVEANLGPAYRDVIPHHSLGFVDHEENAFLAAYVEKLINVGVLYPDEAFIRQWGHMPPVDSQYGPDNPPLLPGKERILDDVTPGGSKSGSGG